MSSGALLAAAGAARAVDLRTFPGGALFPVAAEDEADRDLGEGQFLAEAVLDEPAIVLAEEVRVVDREDDRRRSDGHLGGEIDFR